MTTTMLVTAGRSPKAPIEPAAIDKIKPPIQFGGTGKRERRPGGRRFCLGARQRPLDSYLVAR
jgi:hypothetical protein